MNAVEHGIGETGGNGAHANVQPYLAMRYVLATQGQYPSRDGFQDQGEPFMGEIRAFGFGKVPSGWASCDGQLLPIIQNQALYTLLGTTYGGDGKTSFALPDLRGRSPLGFGQGPGLSAYVMGQKGGSEKVSLQIGEIPKHFHQGELGTDAASTASPGGSLMAGAANYFNSGSFDATLNGKAIGMTGAGAGHENMMPFLTLNYCICLQGIYPQRN